MRRLLLGFGMAAGLLACAPTDSQPEREPATSAIASDRPASGETSPGNAVDPSSAATPRDATSSLDVVLSGRFIQGFAIGDTHVFTIETDVRTRLVATDKAPPHAVKVLLEEDTIGGVHFEGVGASRGRVFVVDSDGAMRSALADGTDVRNEFVLGSSTRILSAPNTLWLADLPRFLGDDLIFRWFGADPSHVTDANAQLVATGTVGSAAVDDEALVYATRRRTTTLRYWVPAGGGDKLLATLPEEGGGLGIDAERAYVHLPMAKEIRSYDRTSGASTVVLSGATFDGPVLLRSDGQNLYMLTDTALRRCSIASCSRTMTVLASELRSARALVVDGTFAWIVMGKGQLGAIARVAK